MIRLAAIGLFISAFAACGGPGGPPLEISDVDVFAPLPGSTMSAAYMTLANNTAEIIVVQDVSSPDFASVELHETRIDNGISRMHRVDRLEIPPRSSVALEEGGIHLMLMKPTTAPGPDRPVRFRIRYDSDGIVIVNAVMQARVQLAEPR